MIRRPDGRRVSDWLVLDRDSAERYATRGVLVAAGLGLFLVVAGVVALIVWSVTR